MPRPTRIDPHLERRPVPRRRPPSDVRFEFRLESRDERLLIDQAHLRQVHDFADVAIIAPFQLRQREVVRFERPQANLGPFREDSDQAGLVVVRIVGDADMVNVDPVLLLERRSLACQFGDALGRIRRNHREYVQVRRLSGEPIVLADDEPANAVEVGRLIERGIQVRQE